MFNLGFPELLALGGLALLVIGPKQLPEVAKAVARVLNEIKNATKDITGTISNVKSEATSTVDSLLNDLSTQVDNLKEQDSEVNGSDDPAHPTSDSNEMNSSSPSDDGKNLPTEEDENQLSLLSEEDLDDERS